MSQSSSTEQRSQENPSNVVQSKTNFMWHALPNHNIVPVPPSINNPGYIPHGINNNAPISYSSAPSYVNVPNPPPYQNYSNIHNEYPIASIPSSQNVSAVPMLVCPPYSPPPLTNSLATQQNSNLTQRGWNNRLTRGVFKKPKRTRTAFKSHQMMMLEQEYARNRYLDRTRRFEMADTLQLHERIIKVWFQNRRMKEKKDPHGESLEEDDDVTTTQSPSRIEISYEYQPNNEAYNGMGVFVEEFPVSSTSALISEAPLLQQSNPGYAITEECSSNHLQVQQYSSPYGEVKISSESMPQSESSVSVGSAAPIETADRNLDLSWIQYMQPKEE